MKNLLLITFLLSTPILMSQENTKASPPVIVAKVALGETVVFEESSITFLDVLEDSRCPSDVTCVWAGQAKVLVKITAKNGTIEKELIFHGIAFGTESENTLFASGSKSYIGYRLSPYPVSTVSPDKTNYFLEVYLK